MKATELMLGNMVQYISDTMPVKTVTLNRISSSGRLSVEEYPHEYISTDNIVGYPITDDVLSKAGFKQREGVFFKDEFDVVVDNDTYYFMGCEIRFVHELQNLFNVVFGIECPIKKEHL